MPKIERARTAHLERIAALANVAHVQLRATVNQFAHRVHIASRQTFGVILDELEKIGVFNQRDFNGFGDAAAPLSIGQ